MVTRDGDLTPMRYVFHAPSEHTIDGQTFPLELQILHKRPGGELLGIAVLFKNGPPPRACFRRLVDSTCVRHWRCSAGDPG